MIRKALRCIRKKMAFMDQSHLKRCQREDEVESESPVAKSGQDESQVGRCEWEAYYELCKQRGFWGLPHARLRRGKELLLLLFTGHLLPSKTLSVL